MVDTKVNLCGWVLDNPVIATSGTFGYGKECSKFYDINMLGTFSFKGTTVEPRFGNPLPRIADCDSGMLLSIGLQNNGIDHVIAHELPEMKQYFHKKVIANCAGFCVDDYVTLAKKLDDQEQVGIIELNVSCPNVGAGGTAIGTDCVNLEKTVKEVKKVTSKTVFVKLTPAVTDIVSITKSAENGGADGISMINTLTGMRINLRTRKSIIQNIAAGYSGPALFPLALSMIYKVYDAVKIPVIGIGGVTSAEHVVEMMMAGATAVGVGSANLVNPYACKEIIEDLPRVMQKYGIEKLSDITGAAHR